MKLLEEKISLGLGVMFIVYKKAVEIRLYYSLLFGIQ